MTTTYGVLERKGQTWRLDAEPHVLIRVKRVFGRVKVQAGKMVLADTPEVCMDLRWVTQRWPLDMSDDDRRYLDESADGELARQVSFGRVLTGEIRPRDLPTALPLREYQAVAVELALLSRGLLVGDEMGVGKTAIGIGAIAVPGARPAVVVTLTYLPTQWKAELERFLPGIRVHVAKRGKAYDLLGPDRGRVGRPFRVPATAVERALWPDVVILTYSKLAGWADALKLVTKTVVFDEVHEFRTGKGPSNNPVAKYASGAVLADACDLRLGLTGTPVYNYGDEMWNILRILRPGVLGTKEEFAREWCSDEKVVQHPAAFGTYLRAAGLYLRRTRADVGRELEPLTTVPVQLDVDRDALNHIGGVAATLARRILARDTAPEERWRASGELDWQLRQATGIAKAPAVASWVELLVEQEGPVVLAGWHKAVYALWTAAFDRAKITWRMFTGDESTAQKLESVRAFLAGEAKVLIISLRSGAGLDGLQYGPCRNVVVGELDWSPQVHRQLIARLHRDGQTKQVSAYFLISDTGSDPIIVDVLGLKRQQSLGIEDPLNQELAPVADAHRARTLARAYLLSIGESVPEESDEDVIDSTEVPEAPAPAETVSRPSLVLTP